MGLTDIISDDVALLMAASLPTIGGIVFTLINLPEEIRYRGNRRYGVGYDGIVTKGATDTRLQVGQFPNHDYPYSDNPYFIATFGPRSRLWEFDQEGGFRALKEDNLCPGLIVLNDDGTFTATAEEYDPRTVEYYMSRIRRSIREGHKLAGQIRDAIANGISQSAERVGSIVPYGRIKELEAAARDSYLLNFLDKAARNLNRDSLTFLNPGRDDAQKYHTLLGLGFPRFSLTYM